ncbi:MAG TPA: tetratricopeptide repeat protein, partial [Chloroflexota bacterium]|nr:tetratricopeptide repeat protein [Chloroflexota bacterium]
MEQIAARLDDALRLLQGSSRSAPVRHQTLQAAIDSSHQLLSEEERALFRRLSVFAGGFTLEAAEAACSEPAAAHSDVLDLLSRLLDQSLVMPVEREHHVEARYRLLETVRQYGSEKLRSAGEREVILEQHAQYFMGRAEQAAREFKGRDQVAWIECLEQDNANLRAALSWSLERGAVDVGLRLAGALWRFWFARGYLAEGRDWLTRLLAQAGPPAFTPAYAQATYGAGVIAWRQGDYAVARALGEQSLAIFQTLEDGEGIGLSLVALANVSGAQGDSAAQHAYLEESLALFREMGDQSGAAAALNNLGELARFEGDYATARRCYSESLALYQGLGNVNGTALVLHNLAHVVQHEGDHRHAARLFHDSLVKYQALGHPGGIAMCLAAAAGLAAVRGQYVRAARLSGTAASAYKAVGATMDGADRVAHDRYMADVRKQLSDEAFAAACAEGRGMSVDQAAQE